MSDEPTEEEEEKYKAEFLMLRLFFHSPLRFSHNYGQFELRHERECLTIDMGKELLPEFSEDKILAIARKEIPDNLRALALGPDGSNV